MKCRSYRSGICGQWLDEMGEGLTKIYEMHETRPDPTLGPSHGPPLDFLNVIMRGKFKTGINGKKWNSGKDVTNNHFLIKVTKKWVKKNKLSY